ncbi:MAG: UDP-N-acetylglucosamine 1-carboxyvinyltransferase [Clostridia bacterium]|nr:UDP-N-acetylglucosamine 1-carboxyvinyltransferase [Clostridia bacterium]
MERFVIRGGNKLNGKITISGAKNAALPIIAASVFAGEPCRIENVPEISDVRMMGKILRYIGAEVTMPEPGVMVVDSKNVKADITIPDEMTRKLRASYYLLGVLLSKYGCASVALPGGCYFGVRPIDQHIKAFEALGATVSTDNAIVDVKCDELYGSSIYLDVVSVGATINAMLAAVKAKGLTVIENAAREPHIVDLANFLNSMGADVRGAGTEVIKIRGVSEMHGCTYSIIPDQIEAGTYMVAAAATGGDVLIDNVIPKHLESISNKLEDCGVTVIEGDESVRIISEGGRPRACRVKTSPHPGFPTDMQPQFATLLTICDGNSTVVEDVWDNRFKYIDQLRRMGANIIVNGDTALITGVDSLHSAPVEADDLRAGAAMIIAGLIANGETSIGNIKLIDRGYENIVEKLTAVGADIARVSFDED